MSTFNLSKFYNLVSRLGLKTNTNSTLSKSLLKNHYCLVFSSQIHDSDPLHIRYINTFRRAYSNYLNKNPIKNERKKRAPIGGSYFQLALISSWLIYDTPEEHEKVLSACEEEVVLLIKKSILATQVVSYQANLCLQRGHLERSEKLFKFLIKRLLNSKQATVEDNAFIEVSLKLAEICYRTDRVEEALSGLNYCVHVQQKKIKGGDSDEDTVMLYSWSLHSMAQIYTQLSTSFGPQPVQEYLTKALKLLSEALSHVNSSAGPTAQQAITIKSDIATIHALRNEHEVALKLLHEIVEIAQEKYEEDLYPQIIISIGNIHLQKEEYEKANSFCSQAKDIASKFKNMEAFKKAEHCIKSSLDIQNNKINIQNAQPQAAS